MHPLLPPALSVLALSICSHGAPGDVEAGFVMNAGGSAGSSVYSAIPQSDGRVLVAGWFSSLGGVTRLNVGRTTAAGALESGFDPASFDATAAAVRSLAVLADGRILLAGEFTQVSGVTRNHVALVSASGVLDAAFNPGANNWIYSTAVQPDGKILLGGTFTAAGGAARNRLVRLLADGSLDTAFNPGADNTVRVIMVQDDGKILLGGNFTTAGGAARNRLARFHADGTLDTTFNPNADGAVYSIALLPDGKILVGGAFSNLGGSTPRARIARLLPTGAVDATFNPGANDNVRCMAVQTDGKVVLGGDFTTLAGAARSRIGRLLADNTLDTAFSTGASGVIYGLALQRDGRVLAGGGYSTFGSFARSDLARLENNPATQSLTIPAPNRVQWLRGGASAEARFVTFELSTNGGTVWTPLGNGSRIAGGWALTGLTLPASGQVRARARLHGGYGNASSTVEETLAPFTFTAQQVWRQAHFGTPNATGLAADNADPEKDGLENLVEFAFGRNPNVPDAAALPQWVLADDDYSLTFTRPANVSGITYVAEYSTSMAPGSWTPAVNYSTPPAYQFLAPAVTQRLYLRVRVTVP